MLAVNGSDPVLRAILTTSANVARSEKSMRNLIGMMTLGASLIMASGGLAQADETKPTIVLVHGAFAESSSWNGVIVELNNEGYRTIAAANPLKSVKGDAATISALIRSLAGPVVLVGHSYGGPVITEAANGNANVMALVYVAGFAPDTGESSLTLSSRFPGSTLGNAIAPVARSDGGQDLYIQPDKFHEQFAADVPEAQARLMSQTQRPVTDAALAEPSGHRLLEDNSILRDLRLGGSEYPTSSNGVHGRARARGEDRGRRGCISCCDGLSPGGSCQDDRRRCVDNRMVAFSAGTEASCIRLGDPT